MTLRVWWADPGELVEHDEMPPYRHKDFVPVIRLTDLREVVEKMKVEETFVAWSDNPNFAAGYEQALEDVLAQLKGVEG